MAKSHFGPIAPALYLKCKTSKWWQESIYGSIMLKLFSVLFFNQVVSIFHSGGGGEIKKVFFSAYLLAMFEAELYESYFLPLFNSSLFLFEREHKFGQILI